MFLYHLDIQMGIYTRDNELTTPKSIFNNGNVLAIPRDETGVISNGILDFN